MKQIVCSSLDELSSTAQEIIQALDSRVVLFTGEMGAGKTTMIGEICRQMGVDNEVSSPTFSLVNEYLGSDGAPVFHFDMYRIEDENEALDMGIEEYFTSGNWCFVEWPERIENLLPADFVQVDVKIGADRKVRIVGVG